MDRKFKGIVIGSKDSGEKDKLLTIFSLELGKISARLVGVKKSNAKLKAFKELFCFADFVTAVKNDFHIVTEAAAIDSFHGLVLNIDKYYEACSVLDVLDKITGYLEPNAGLFLETVSALKALCYDEVKTNYIIDKFLIDIFEGMGYKLSVSKCRSCNEDFFGGKFLNLDLGEITCKNCRTKSSIEVSDKAFGALRVLSRTPYDKLTSVKLCEGSEDELLKILKLNFRGRFAKDFAAF